MNLLAKVLRLLSPVFVVVAVLHLVLGLRADVLLGAAVPPSVVADPTLDSQNRFYGVAFAIYGVILFICAGDLQRYAPVFRAALAVFFLGGVARLVSWAIYGQPSALVIALGLVELVAPALLWAWFSRVCSEA